MSRLSALALLAVLLASAIGGVARAEEPVRHLPLYVQPYYEAGLKPGDTPKVAVHRQYDAKLASNDPATIQEVARGIDADAGFVTPMTLMVLAIRHYDVGLRDESVFWFYAAKDRYVTLNAVLDMQHPSLSQVKQATADFASLAGPFINGYAFCDLKKQADARRRASQWVASHPYQAVFAEQLPARAGDRRSNLQAGLAKIESDLAKEAEHLARPDVQQNLAKTRQANGTTEKFCW